MQQPKPVNKAPPNKPKSVGALPSSLSPAQLLILQARKERVLAPERQPKPVDSPLGKRTYDDFDQIAHMAPTHFNLPPEPTGIRLVQHDDCIVANATSKLTKDKYNEYMGPKYRKIDNVDVSVARNNVHKTRTTLEESYAASKGPIIVDPYCAEYFEKLHELLRTFQNSVHHMCPHEQSQNIALDLILL